MVPAEPPRAAEIVPAKRCCAVPVVSVPSLRVRVVECLGGVWIIAMTFMTGWDADWGAPQLDAAFSAACASSRLACAETTVEKVALLVAKFTGGCMYPLVILLVGSKMLSIVTFLRNSPLGSIFMLSDHHHIHVVCGCRGERGRGFGSTS